MAGVLLVFCVLHREAIFLGRHWLYGDNGFQNFPWHWFVWDRVRHGGMTAPCLSMGLGMAPVAEPQVQCFYPLNTALWPLGDPFTSFTLKLLLHMLMAVAGVYVLARQQGRSPLGAAGAAVVMAGGGFTIWRIVHTPLICGLAWAPWIILLFLTTLRTGSKLAFLGLVGCTAGQILSGQPQMALYTWLACLVLGYVEGVGMQPSGSVPGFLRPLGVAAGALAAAGAVCMVQLMPTWELMLYGQRASGVAPGYLTMWGCSLRELAVNALGNMELPLKWEKTAFPGTLGLIGAVYCAIRVRDKQTRAWLVLALVALALAWTQGNPLYHLLAFVPVFNRFRAHSRIAFLFSLACGMLLAKMLDDRQAPAKWRPALVGAGVAAGLELIAVAATGQWGLGPWRAGDPLSWQAVTLAGFIIIALVWRERTLTSALPRALLVALAAFELTVMAQGVNPTMIRQQWLDDPAQRVFALAAERARPERTAFLRWKDGLPTDVGILWDVRYPRAHTPLAPSEQDDLNQFLYGPNSARVLAAYGVKWLASPDDWAQREGLKRVGTVGEWGLWENPLRVSEAYIPAVVAPGDTMDTLELLHSLDSDPRYAVFAPRDIVGEGFRPGPEAQVAVRSSTDTELVLETRSPSPCVVVAARQWTPHWSATVDGRQMPCFQTNLTLLSTVSAPGMHTVTFRYDMDLRRPGAVSALAVLVWLVLLLAEAGRRRSPPSGSEIAAGLRGPDRESDG